MRKSRNNFRGLGIILVMQLVCSSLIAQAPQKISYQAAIRNAADLLITSQPIGMRLSILQGSSSGTVVFSETHTATTSPNGVLGVAIGTGTLVSGNFATIDWEAGPYFIKTETDPAGGTTYTITGTTQLISVPYSFYATKGGNSFSGDYNDLINKPPTDGSETKINGGTFVTVTGSGTAASPYVINANPVMGGFSHYLGEFFNGGIIFHLWKREDGTEHALIVSLSESGALSLQNPTSNTNATSVWDGRGNTDLYTNSQAKDYATALGYGWYVPAIDELNILWQNRFHANKGLLAAGGTLLDGDKLWSSTESSVSNSLGWWFDFTTGEAYGGNSKASTNMVRAVRGLITIPSLITTTAVSNVTNASASSGGNLTSDDGAPITARGVCWSTSQNPTTSDNITNDGTGIGTWVSSITGLANNTTYYVRAWATNSAGTAYGNERSFTTASTAPVVTTTAASGLTKTSASSGGNVTDERGEPVTARGICWNTTGTPTTADSKTTDGAGGGVFASSMTGLTTGTTYYVRAYATNSVGTSYGNQITFTTLAIPTVTTSATAYTSAGAGTSGGNVTNEGGVSVTARGVCWSTSPNPTTADSKTTNGSGPGAFASALSGLTLGTTYYVRAYATSVEGTGYGNEVAITTLIIGEEYQGGMVAWLDGTGLHGLILSKVDMNAGANVRLTNVTGALSGASSTTNGAANTAAWIVQGGHISGAASLCDAYTNLDYGTGIYSDWYLAASTQWTNIWANKVTLGLTYNLYWTSTESGNNTAKRCNNGALNDEWKSNAWRARAVRTF